VVFFIAGLLEAIFRWLPLSVHPVVHPVDLSLSKIDL